MATSGSRDFDLDVADIIEEAYERCGLEVRTGYDARTARRSLNLMFADWANRGLNLWTVKQATVSLTSGTATYAFDATYTDLLEVVIRRSSVDYQLDRMSRGDYLHLPNKSQSGRPSQFFYNRQTTPEITLWPTPDSSSDSIVYYYVQRIQDADALGQHNRCTVPVPAVHGCWPRILHCHEEGAGEGAASEGGVRRRVPAGSR